MDLLDANSNIYNIGIVDAHDDRLPTMEKDLVKNNYTLKIHYTLNALKDRVSDTRTTLRITTTLEILVDMQTLHLNVLRSLINGFYHLLSGHLSPDLIGVKKKLEIRPTNADTQERIKLMEISDANA